MARMIPPAILPAYSSTGEQDVFERLRSETGTHDWIVLHSLDIAHHLRQVAGEADFVIIVPSLGVLCLEVKGCHSLHRQDGTWYYGRDPKGDFRGPFKQSSEAMHSLRQQIVRSDPTLSGVPFWSAVAFPFIEFAVASDEWHSWQIIDEPRFRAQPLATLIRAGLHSARSHLSSQKTSGWFRKSDRVPDQQQAAAIARILRPNFEFAERPAGRRARQKAEIIRYTEEQFVSLDAMEGNDRVLFTGPAGTGKTVLAIEAARRAAESGKKVLFLCYNRLLGQWLSTHPTLQHDGLTVRTLHQYLIGIAGTTPPDKADDSFWRKHLPEMAAMELLNGHDDVGRFDLLVIDEIQDLLEPTFLDNLDIIVSGGLKAGHWFFFGDFERQMLYGQVRSGTDELIRARLGSFTRCSLRVNCRNTPRIATLSHLLGKLAPNYSRVLRPDDRVEPLISYFATPSQQRKELANVLERLQRESFSPDDIVILSPKAGSRCVAATIKEEPWSERIASFDRAESGYIPYSTIQSFKGLESPAIVVTDIEHVDSEHFSSLFYVAATRALERLYILVHETAKPVIVTALLGKQPDRT